MSKYFCHESYLCSIIVLPQRFCHESPGHLLCQQVHFPKFLKHKFLLLIFLLDYPIKNMTSHSKKAVNRFLSWIKDNLVNVSLPILLNMQRSFLAGDLTWNFNLLNTKQSLIKMTALMNESSISDQIIYLLHVFEYT